MPQQKAWEREYAARTFVTGNMIPQADFVRFCEWYKKKMKKEKSGDDSSGFSFEGLSVLDLGCGIGRNAFYLAERGSHVTGLEIAKNALDVGKKYAKENNLEKNVVFVHQSIGEKFPVNDNSIDIALDVISSNSLHTNERKIYFEELNRTLKQDGYLFIRGLSLDGDEHAKYLLKNHPGSEVGMYVMPDTGIEEKVWTKAEFEKTYGEYFEIEFYKKVAHYTEVAGRKYKRQYFVAYLRKK